MSRIHAPGYPGNNASQVRISGPLEHFSDCGGKRLIAEAIESQGSGSDRFWAIDNMLARARAMDTEIMSHAMYRVLHEVAEVCKKSWCYCVVSRPSIGVRCGGMDRHNVRKLVKKLEDIGLVSLWAPPGGIGGGNSGGFIAVRCTGDDRTGQSIAKLRATEAERFTGANAVLDANEDGALRYQESAETYVLTGGDDHLSGVVANPGRHNEVEAGVPITPDTADLPVTGVATTPAGGNGNPRSGGNSEGSGVATTPSGVTTTPLMFKCKNQDSREVKGKGALARETPPARAQGFDDQLVELTGDKVANLMLAYPELEFPRVLRDAESLPRKRRAEMLITGTPGKAARKAELDREAERCVKIDERGHILLLNGERAEQLKLFGSDKALDLALIEIEDRVDVNLTGHGLMTRVRGLLAKRVLWNVADAKKQSWGGGGSGPSPTASSEETMARNGDIEGAVRSYLASETGRSKIGIMRRDKATAAARERFTKIHQGGGQ